MPRCFSDFAAMPFDFLSVAMIAPSSRAAFCRRHAAPRHDIVVTLIAADATRARRARAYAAKMPEADATYTCRCCFSAAPVSSFYAFAITAPVRLCHGAYSQRLSASALLIYYRPLPTFFSPFRHRLYSMRVTPYARHACFSCLMSCRKIALSVMRAFSRRCRHYVYHPAQRRYAVRFQLMFCACLYSLGLILFTIFCYLRTA